MRQRPGRPQAPGAPARVSLAALAMLALAAGGCAAGGTAHADAPVELRLGHLPNVTHAPAIVGVEQGLFAAALGPDATLTTHVAAAGPELIEALWSGALDAAYLGPNPVINAHVRSSGDSVRVVAGAASGGTALVTRPGLHGPRDLRGTVLASPGLGNTQDVALRAWLAGQGLATSIHGGGAVSIGPQPPAQILEAFRERQIDGAWVPEPWATRMVVEAGGRILVDERDLWPHTGGEHTTTLLVVSRAFLEQHPDLVHRLLEGHLDAIDRLHDQGPALAAVVADGIAAVTSSRPDTRVTATALDRLTFTADPLLDTLRGAADNVVAVGLLDEVDLAGIHDLEPLNTVLRRRGEPEVRP